LSNQSIRAGPLIHIVPSPPSPSSLPPSLPPSLPQAQQIDRVLQAFATAAFEQCMEGKGGREGGGEGGGEEEGAILASTDVAYLLSFSIIMLNTGGEHQLSRFLFFGGEWGDRQLSRAFSGSV
jgi:hypothetical protein